VPAAVDDFALESRYSSALTGFDGSEKL